MPGIVSIEGVPSPYRNTSVDSAQITFTEPITLVNPEAARLSAVFLLTVETGKETDEFQVYADRARLRGWEVVKMEGSHNPHWFQPENFVVVLTGILQS